MSKSKFDSFVSRGSINDAWRDFWRRGHSQSAAGIDGITPAQFQVNLERNLQSILRDLNKGYEFHSLRPIAIDKSNGSQRIICISSVRDRVVQRMLGSYLNSRAAELGILNHVSFGFIKSSVGAVRGVQAARDTAIRLRQDSQWVYKTDITAFFDRIERDLVVNTTIRRLRAPSFRSLLTSVVGCEIDNSSSTLNRIVRDKGIQKGRGLRQGMPVSPILSNVVLEDFDRRMIEKSYRMVRYADDLIFFADSKDECHEIDNVVRLELGRIGHEVPTLGLESKTEIAAPDQSVDFLGLSLSKGDAGSYELVLTRAQIDRVLRVLGQNKDVAQLLKDGLDYSKIGNKIDSQIGGYMSAYSAAQNIGWFKQQLKAKRSELHRSILEDVFGKQSVGRLSAQSKLFMGVDF